MLPSKPQQQKIFPKDYALIREMYKKKSTLGEIGEVYGVGRERIRQILKKLGVEKIRRVFEYHCTICNQIIIRHIRPEVAPTICSLCRQVTKNRSMHPNRKVGRRKFEPIPRCTVCHTEGARLNGMCRRCYNRHRYHTNPRLKEQNRINQKRRYWRRKIASLQTT